MVHGSQGTPVATVNGKSCEETITRRKCLTALGRKRLVTALIRDSCVCPGACGNTSVLWASACSSSYSQRTWPTWFASSSTWTFGFSSSSPAAFWPLSRWASDWPCTTWLLTVLPSRGVRLLHDARVQLAVPLHSLLECFAFMWAQLVMKMLDRYISISRGLFGRGTEIPLWEAWCLHVMKTLLLCMLPRPCGFPFVLMI